MYYSDIIKFIAPGDLVRSKDENIHFHKGFDYEIVKCFVDPDFDLVTIVKDKEGKEVRARLDYDTYWEYPSKTVKAAEKRMLRARLEAFWDSDALMTMKGDNHYDFEGTVFMKVSFAHFINNPDAKASLEQYRISPCNREPRTGFGYTYADKDGNKYPYVYFKSKQEFYEYFENKFKGDDEWHRDFTIPHLPGAQQVKIDSITHIATMNFPRVNNEVMNESGINLDPMYHWSTSRHATSLEFEPFLEYLNRWIFDGKSTVADVKLIFQSVVNAYINLPPSYGATSVTKLLQGKGKVKSGAAIQYSGIYAGLLKYDQMFALVDVIETWLYDNKVFVRKEDYGTSEEWRGAFEFIGSKAIDKAKAETYLK